MTWTIRYYSETVQQDLDKWPAGILASYIRITERMKILGPNLGLPYTRALGGGLIEVRAKGREGIGRAFFCTTLGRHIVVLHSFIKKTQKTPQKELKLARRRLKEVHS